MAKKALASLRTSAGFSIQFTLFGLIIFCVSLVAATGVVAYSVLHSLHDAETQIPAVHGHHAVTEGKAPTSEEIPEWGELVTHDVDIELPEEYIAAESGAVDKLPLWTFPGMTADEVHKLMGRCGLSEEQIARALSPELAVSISSNVVIQPDEALTVSLATGARANLYRELARRPGNNSKTSPFCFPGDSIEDVIRTTGLDAETAQLMRALLYRYEDTTYFSDYYVVSRHLGSEEQREEFFRTLSRQKAVLVRLRIRPTTDVDKLTGYWTGPGVRIIDTRPLLESLRRVPEGSTLSVMYMLPAFARERLYTYPLPTEPGVRPVNCYWTSMNFFNDKPDDRFLDPNYCMSYLTTNYYQLAKPTHYGDLVFLLDENGMGVHSAVYIADDIVFTKNGDGHRQPWMFMRLKNLIAKYAVTGAPRLLAYRSKNL